MIRLTMLTGANCVVCVLVCSEVFLEKNFTCGNVRGRNGSLRSLDDVGVFMEESLGDSIQKICKSWQLYLLVGVDLSVSIGPNSLVSDSDSEIPYATNSV